MKKITLLLSLCVNFLFGITNNIYTVSAYVDKKSFAVSGGFHYYDFADSPKHWDYVYKTRDDNILRLRGNPPTQNDLFGWKEIELEDITLIADYYFVHIGDFDADNDSRFDWILVNVVKNTAYKLMGASLNDTFLWSDKLPVKIQSNDYQVSFHKNYTDNEIIDTPIPPTPATTTPTPATTTPPTTTTTPTKKPSSMPPSIPSISGGLDSPPPPPI